MVRVLVVGDKATGKTHLAPAMAQLGAATDRAVESLTEFQEQVMSGYGKTGIPRSRPEEQTRANWTRAQLDAIDWTAVPRSFGTCVMRLGVWSIWTADAVAPGSAYVNKIQNVVVTHPRTWSIVSFKPETQRMFLHSMTTGAAGMKFINMDAGPYAEVARLEAERNQLPRKDALETLHAEAQSLIIQASGLTTDPTPMQLKIFTERYASLQKQLEEVEERVAKARSLVDLAGDAVMGAC